MAGRGATTLQKRQKEQKRKEKREEKLARRAQRKEGGGLTALEAMNPEPEVDDSLLDRYVPEEDQKAEPA